MVLFWFLGFCFLFLIFLAPLGLPCCVRVFSSCAVRASPCGGFSCCREWTLEWKLQQLWLGLTALWHVGSSWTRDRIHVPHTGRQILNHWTNKKVPLKLLCGNFMILSSKKKKATQPKSYVLFGDVTEDCSLEDNLSASSEESFQRHKVGAGYIGGFLKNKNKTWIWTLKCYC